MGQGIYLYCLTGSDSQEANFSFSSGIDESNPVYTVPFNNILAVVSKVSLAEFGEAALTENLKNMTWLEQKVFIHEEIIEQVARHQTVLPMKFCTIFSSAEILAETLEESYQVFLTTLERLAGKEEWGLKIFFDAKILEKEISLTSINVQELKKELSQAPPGRAYFLSKKLKNLMAEEVRLKSLDLVNHCWQELVPFACGTCQNNLLDKEVTGREDENLLNAAFLVNQDKVPLFQEKFNLLAKEYTQYGLSIVISGPWPPYNFSGGGEKGE